MAGEWTQVRFGNTCCSMFAAAAESAKREPRSLGCRGGLVDAGCLTWKEGMERGECLLHHQHTALGGGAPHSTSPSTWQWRAVAWEGGCWPQPQPPYSTPLSSPHAKHLGCKDKGRARFPAIHRLEGPALPSALAEAGTPCYGG